MEGPPPSSVYLLKTGKADSATLYGETKQIFIDILASIFREKPTSRGIILVEASKETIPVQALLFNVLNRTSVIIDHSTTLVDLHQAVQASNGENLLITTSSAILYLFCFGMLRIEQLDFIIFDSLRSASNNHPYCSFMEVDKDIYCLSCL